MKLNLKNFLSRRNLKEYTKEFEISTLGIILSFYLNSCELLSPDGNNTKSRFYYYEGKKIYLELIDTIINVNYIDKATFEEVKELNRMYNFPGPLDSTRFFPNILRSDNYYYTVPNGLSINNYLTHYNTGQIIESYGNNPLVRYVTPSFKSDDGTIMGLTDEFIVSFNSNVISKNDIIAINNNYHVEIVEKMIASYDSLLYILRVTKDSPYDALDMSNTYVENSIANYAGPNWGLRLDIGPFFLQ